MRGLNIKFPIQNPNSKIFSLVFIDKSVGNVDPGFVTENKGFSESAEHESHVVLGVGDMFFNGVGKGFFKLVAEMIDDFFCSELGHKGANVEM